jgi:hypothetical protein
MLAPLARNRRKTLKWEAINISLIGSFSSYTSWRAGGKNTCANFVPHSLTERQKTKRVTMFEGFLQIYQTVALLLETSFGSITTILKTPLGRGEDNKLSLRLRRFACKSPGWKGLLHSWLTKYAPGKKNICLDETVNGKLNVQMLDLANKVATSRESSWSLFNDSVPTHPATAVKHFLANRSVVEVSCQS